MLSDQIKDYVNAAFSGLWVQTHEPDEAEREIQQACAANGWKAFAWDITGQGHECMPVLPNAADPVGTLGAVNALAEPGKTVLIVLHNFHRFLGSAEVVQATFNQLVRGKQSRVFLVVLAPTTQIPVEVEKLFVVLEHDLPTRGQLAKIANDLIADDHDQPTFLPEGTAPVLDASAGLTRYEAEAAFALSLARTGSIKPEAVWDLKSQALRKQNLLTLHRGGETLDGLGGLAALKNFCRRALTQKERSDLKARGLLLLGVPGTGKSAFAKALGTATGRPTLVLDMGSLYGSLVGQTEANVRQALKIADAMAPCILFVDEIEKGLAGIGGSGDSGVATRLFGTLLTWLAEHTSDVFFVGTCNRIEGLPPEFSRAERFDAVFFLDLPTTPEKDLIWARYRRHFGLSEDMARPNDTDWTGAEIKACCRLSALLDLPLKEAAKNVVPVAVTASEQIEKLRGWAAGRCLSAGEPGIYSREQVKAKRTVLRN